jgi:hypothetical protein
MTGDDALRRFELEDASFVSQNIKFVELGEGAVSEWMA